MKSLKAKLLFNPDQGDKEWVYRSGFRPTILLGKEQTSCIITSSDTSKFEKGKAYLVKIELFLWDSLKDDVKNEYEQLKEIIIMSGVDIIAKGEILEKL